MALVYKDRVITYIIILWQGFSVSDDTFPSYPKGYRTSDIIYVASRHWLDGGCSTHEESLGVDLSHMMNRGSSGKSSGREEQGSHKTEVPPDETVQDFH